MKRLGQSKHSGDIAKSRDVVAVVPSSLNTAFLRMGPIAFVHHEHVEVGHVDAQK